MCVGEQRVGADMWEENGTEGCLSRVLELLASVIHSELQDHESTRSDDAPQLPV